MMYDISKESNLLGCIQEYSSKQKEDIVTFWLGLQPYDKIWQLQKDIHKNISEGINGDIVLLLEHPHIYTLGKNANNNHLLPSYPKNAEVIDIDRGGDITYHGPGQLVGYPIINLKNYKKSVSWYMRTLEDIIIATLDEMDITSRRREKLTGVWVEDEKICAFGVRMAKWTTMHGFALNLNPDMTFFNGIIPCGIFEYGVTSIEELSDIDLSIKDLAKKVSNHCNKYLNKTVLAESFA